jgi:hypothetical protein
VLEDGPLDRDRPNAVLSMCGLRICWIPRVEPSVRSHQRLGLAASV